MARTLLLTSFHHRFVNTSHTQLLGVIWLTNQLSTSYVVFLFSLHLLHKVFTGGKLDLVLTTWSSAVSTWKHCNVTLAGRQSLYQVRYFSLQSKNPLSTIWWPGTDHKIVLLFKAAHFQYQVDSELWFLSPHSLVNICWLSCALTFKTIHREK